MPLVPSVMTPAELMRRVGTARAPLLVDVRRRAAYDAAVSTVPGAIWRDPLAIDDWASTLPAGAELVLYCVHGHQVSQAASARLRASGAHARYLEGGIEAYATAGGTTVLKAHGLPSGAERATRWVTRARPRVDRIACPWFIRRFIDPQAEILFVEAAWVREAATELQATPFDVADVEFGHDGAHCSFDAFLTRYGIADPALAHLARVVRGADTGELDLAPEAAGLLAVSLGLSAQDDDDHATLARGMVVYDALYAWARGRAAATGVPEQTRALA